MDGELPEWYRQVAERHAGVMQALGALGQATGDAGPLDGKTAQLLRMVAGAAIRSEGAVHSHARRALEQGASADELRHALLIAISTLGFPTVSAALSWVEDVLASQADFHPPAD